MNQRKPVVDDLYNRKVTDTIVDPHLNTQPTEIPPLSERKHTQ